MIRKNKKKKIKSIICECQKKSSKRHAKSCVEFKDKGKHTGERGCVCKICREVDRVMRILNI